MGESDDEDFWHVSISHYPDEVFEAELRHDAEQQAHLWNLLTTGKEYAQDYFEGLLANVRILYGTAVSERVREDVRREIGWASTWSCIGLTLNLHAENPRTPHSRIDILGTVNVDLSEIVEKVAYDSAPLLALWSPELEDEENLEMVSANVESVHAEL
jgi:hypothetical protein